MAVGRTTYDAYYETYLRMMETRRAQAQFTVTFISTFNLSSLILKSSVDLFIYYLFSRHFFSKWLSKIGNFVNIKRFLFYPK